MDATQRVGVVEGNVFRLVNELPEGAVAALRPLIALATLPALPLLAGAALRGTRRLRPAVDLIVAGVAASGLGELLRLAVGRGRPETLIAAAQIRVPVDTVLAHPRSSRQARAS